MEQEELREDVVITLARPRSGCRYQQSAILAMRLAMIPISNSLPIHARGSCIIIVKRRTEARTS